jgi:uncharacterized heparinase superfamily protein
MEALTGLLYAALAVGGCGAHLAPATEGLAAGLARDVDAGGGVASRNPEALLEMATMLGWSLAALEAKGIAPPDALLRAQSAMVSTLAALRHADGGLPRFHGGGRGRAGRLDRVMADWGPGEPMDGDRAMGFARAAHGRATLVVDAEAPPMGSVSGSAHAGTLAVELTSGGCPVIVNCGPGGAFGPDWHRAGRATASHSTLSMDGASSAKIGHLIPVDGRRIAPLILGPTRVECRRATTAGGTTLLLGHDGYVADFGLTHLRRLVLSADGATLDGEDALRADSAADKARFEAARTAAGSRALPFDLRFHLHPSAQAALGPNGQSVSIGLPSGEAWTFRTGDARPLALEPSVHMEPGRRHPQACLQVVLSDRVVKYAATVDWSLTRVRTAAENP